MAGELAGQVAIVTGAGRGIGRATALAFAAAGAAVVATARTQTELDETVALIQAAGGRAIAVAGDVTDEHGVEHVVAETRHQFGPVDVLVNNAGGSFAQGRFWESSIDDWWRTIEVNLKGPFLYIRAVLPEMMERRTGRIVNVSSRSAGIASPGRSSYASAKAAVVRLTDTLEAEVRDHGIKVFVIHPGRVPTAASERFLASESGQRWIAEAGADVLESLRVPPERPAELCLFLASGKGDALSGRFLSVMDDVEDLARRADQIQRDDAYMLRLRL